MVEIEDGRDLENVISHADEQCYHGLLHCNIYKHWFSVYIVPCTIILNNIFRPESVDESNELLVCGSTSLSD